MEVVPFDISHFDTMEIEERDMVSRKYRELYKTFIPRGPSFTLMNGVPIFCGGIVIMWPGCGHAWMLPSIHVKEHPASTYKYANLMIDEFMNKYKLHRVQADVRADDQKANNFVIQLGFQFEGLMRKYWADGADYFLYARTR